MNIELLRKEIAKYIEDNYEPETHVDGGFVFQKLTNSFKQGLFEKEELFDEADYDLEMVCEAQEHSNLDDIVNRKHETFQEMLFRLIDESGKEDTEIYKKANIDRKYFSKIRNGTVPVKNTVMALCLALELNGDQSRDLMNKAGYAFSNASKKDLIVEYCIDNKVYDLMKINLILEEYNESIIR